VASAQPARPSPDSRVIRPTRSVVAEPGRVTFVPKKQQAAVPAPVPVMHGVRPGQSRQDVPAAAHEPPSGEAKSAPVPERPQQQVDTHKPPEAANHPEPGPQVKERHVTEEQKTVQPKAQDQKPDQKKEKDNKGKEKDKDKEKDKEKDK